MRKGLKFPEHLKKRFSEKRRGAGNPMFGKPSWNRGIPMSQEMKDKISKTKKANKPILSDESRMRYSLAHRGSKSPNWRGGVSKFQHTLRRSFKYIQWRNQIFTRDNYTCQKCGVRGGVILHADHIKPFAIILEESGINDLDKAYSCVSLWDTDNGRTLCKDCHLKTDTHGINTKRVLRDMKIKNDKPIL